MDANAEYLNYIYQNAKMGTDTLGQLINIAEDKEFTGTLNSQFKEYESIEKKAEEYLKQRNKEEKDISLLQKVSADVMINVKTLTDKSASHIAGMLMQGSTMGVIDIIKNNRKYNSADSDIKELGQRLLTLEENNINECKRYI
ncbi:MAG: hypothetical protein K0R05_2048 [Anaerocolumna sp.]|jgi:hypothetical protein|nr:hypothetical protein [Anaerocolumna sp.]